MIRQLCYLSTATSDWAEGDLARLFQSASLYNEAARVSGLLAYGGGVFFQVLEGPRDNVGAAFARICRDPRHHDLRLLQDETVASRDFGSFPLALRSFDPSAVPGIRRIYRRQRHPGDRRRPRPRPDGGAAQARRGHRHPGRLSPARPGVQHYVPRRVGWPPLRAAVRVQTRLRQGR